MVACCWEDLRSFHWLFVWVTFNVVYLTQTVLVVQNVNCVRSIISLRTSLSEVQRISRKTNSNLNRVQRRAARFTIKNYRDRIHSCVKQCRETSAGIDVKRRKTSRLVTLHKINNGLVAINPFTAMLAVPSLEKRPIKVPNLKPLKLFGPRLMSTGKDFYENAQYWKYICYRTIKYTVWRSIQCALFSPEILQAGAVKGLTKSSTGRTLKFEAHSNFSKRGLTVAFYWDISLWKMVLSASFYFYF